MANDLRLQVVLDVAGKALGPLKAITQGSANLTEKVRAAQAELRKLGQQQKLIGAFNATRQAMGEAGNKLRVLQAQMDAMRQSGTANARAMAQQEKAVIKQTAEFDKQRQSVLRLRQSLTKMGVTSVGDAQRDMAKNVAEANRQLDAQKAKLDRLTALKAKHGKQMAHMGMLAAGGVGAMAAGRQAARPVGTIMTAYSELEDAKSQLKIAFMQADGSVVSEYQQILEKAKEQGDRLPGTTADFINMMTVLRQEGMSAKSVLGGLGDTAANLGVLLKTGPEEAAKKMAKMQDSLRATEDEMADVGDQMQRAHYLGADMDFMQSAIGNAAPMLDVMKKKGAEAMRILTPFAVMMNQAGMEDGGSVGNAMRKVHDRAMNPKKVSGANDVIKGIGGGFKLDFTDGKGEFGGLDKLFEQLGQLRKLSTANRGLVMNSLWGDDAETNRVLSKWINDGLDGYNQTARKLAAQADLQTRVNEQLGTLTNVKDAAGGAFSNVMAAAGQTIEEDLKKIIKWMGKLIEAVGGFIEENPKLVRYIMLGVLGFSALVTGVGALAVAVASVLGPMLLMRFLLARIGINFNMLKLAAKGITWAFRGVGTAIAWVAKTMGPWLLTALRMAGTAFMWVARGVMLLGRAGLAFVMTPLGAALAVLALGAYLVWKNWDKIKPVLMGAWAWIQATWPKITAYFSNMGATAWNWGADLIDGLVNGIKSKFGELKNVVAGMAESVKLWFTAPVKIQSPSRVFMEYGGFLSEGIALGIANKAPMVAAAAASMAALPGLVAAPAMAAPGLSAPSSQAAAAPSSYAITINAAPGQDPQAIARAVSAELDRRERSQQSRGLSGLRDR